MCHLSFVRSVAAAVGLGAAATVSAGNTITTVDSQGNVGAYASMTLGLDGLPVISYSDSTNHSLKVAKCADPSCAAPATITTVDQVSAMYTSIAVGPDGLPVISYYALADSATLRVAKCINPSCTGASTITTVEGVAGAGLYSRIAIGADGLPVIVYYDHPHDVLKVAKCANPACTATSRIGLIDRGWYPAIAIGVDGFPIISYYYPTGSLRLVKCNDATCATGGLVLIESGGGWNSSIAIGFDGFPVISYTGDVGDPGGVQGLKIARCTKADCTKGTLVKLDSRGGEYNSVAIGSDGVPAVAYATGFPNYDLRVARCADPLCASAGTVETIDSYGNVGSFASAIVGIDDRVAVAYFDVTNGDLKVAKCSTPGCASFSVDVDPIGFGRGKVMGTTSAGTIIDCGSECSATVDDGTVVTFVATPDNGFKFGGWGGDCSGSGPCVLVVEKSTTILARFDLPGTGSNADVSIEQSAAPNPAASGRDLVLTLRVKNNGPSNAVGVMVFEEIPTDVLYIWSSASCAFTARTVMCAPPGGFVGPGSDDVFKVVVRPVSGGSFAGVASVTFADSDPNPANNASAVFVPIAASPPGVPVLRYRLYSDVTKEHHFTTDLNEYNTLGALVGTWVKEGTVGKILDNPGSFGGVEAVPYYRLYDTSTRWHHWTSDPNEYYLLGTYPNWTQEGVDGWILPKSATGATQLYRLNYPYLGSLHHWTIDANEYTTLINSFGWIGEGGSGYVIQ